MEGCKQLSYGKCSYHLSAERSSRKSSAGSGDVGSCIFCRLPDDEATAFTFGIGVSEGTECDQVRRGFISEDSDSW